MSFAKPSPLPRGSSSRGSMVRSLPTRTRRLPSRPTLFPKPRKRDPRTPSHSTWDGSKDPLPEPVHLPQFKNYQFRYGAYPGYRDCSKNPQWPDGTVSEHERRQKAPAKYFPGRIGRTEFRRDERVCGDLSPKAREAHEFIWFSLKDPDLFDLKPARRWDPAGVKKIAPPPFYNREDGHFLLHNTCTIANLFMMPEMRRLQCYWLPKLPKLPKTNFNLPIKKRSRHFNTQLTTEWKWTEAWNKQLPIWYTPAGNPDPDVAEAMAEERRKFNLGHSKGYYSMNKETIDKLRVEGVKRKSKVKTPVPKPKPIDYHVKLGKESLNGVRKVEELFENRVLRLWENPPVDIMEILKAEAATRKKLAEEARCRRTPTPPPLPSICGACDYSGDSGVRDAMNCQKCVFINTNSMVESPKILKFVRVEESLPEDLPEIDPRCRVPKLELISSASTTSSSSTGAICQTCKDTNDQTCPNKKCE